MNLDPTSKTLILGNILATMVVVLLGYDFAVLIWIYWLESVVMGVFAFLKLFLSGIAQPRMLATTIFLSVFFAFHYGAFHFAYFVFLTVLPWFSVSSSEIPWILGAGGILVASHAFSFNESFLKMRKKVLPVAEAAKLQFSEPYSRIVPIHMTIILSGLVIGVFGIERNLGLLLLFMGLKTLSDLHFHLVKHKMS